MVFRNGFFLSVFLLILTACQNSILQTEAENRKLTDNFKDYWFDGQAEITSYTLEQERYGEMREGTAVLIYVTEDFLSDAQVKANQPSETNPTVLKLNKTKNYLTGIYPYSIMNSVFYPIEVKNHALKVSTSIQEWCGHTYTQLNNRNNFEIRSHSYFQGEADQSFSLEKIYLEDEVWTQLRINPEELPVGNIEMIPSFEYARLRHRKIKPYYVQATLKLIDGVQVYNLLYHELDRTLSIEFEPVSPFKIIGWEETIGDFTSKATIGEQIKSDYWNKNKNEDLPLRDLLNLN
jgi:hypothetical protein